MAITDEKYVAITTYRRDGSTLPGLLLLGRDRRDGRPEQLRSLPAEHLEPGLVDVLELERLHVEQQDRVGVLLEQQPVALFALGERLLAELAAGDVALDSDEARRLALRVEDREGAQVDVDLSPRARAADRLAAVGAPLGSGGVGTGALRSTRSARAGVC